MMGEVQGRPYTRRLLHSLQALFPLGFRSSFPPGPAPGAFFLGVSSSHSSQSLALALWPPAADALPHSNDLMHPKLVRQAFTHGDWLFEHKLDGFRALARRVGAAAELLSRNGLPLGPAFPEILEALTALPGDIVVDCELVATDERGHPAWGRLQRRSRMTVTRTIARVALEEPATHGDRALARARRGRQRGASPVHPRDWYRCCKPSIASRRQYPGFLIFSQVPCRPAR
jgi:hypothetical protein